jgi:predicted  nucleic acid-binding Zn-ribbon protein
LEASREKLAKRVEDLEGKQAELAEIVAETQAEEALLLQLSSKLAEEIDSRLLSSYQRIRGAAKNGLAVVPIERQASAGSFIKIPPQRRIDIAQRKRIIVDEHSGRILVDKDLADEVRQRIEDMVAQEMGSVGAR